MSINPNPFADHVLDTQFDDLVRAAQMLTDAIGERVYDGRVISGVAQDILLNEVAIALGAVCADHVVLSRHRGTFAEGAPVMFFPREQGERNSAPRETQ
jgi:hypothetical protein